MLHPGGGGRSQTFVLQLYLHHADDSTCAARLNAMTDQRTQLGADEWSSVCSRAVSAAGNSSRSKEEAGSGSLSSAAPTEHAKVRRFEKAVRWAASWEEA